MAVSRIDNLEFLSDTVPKTKTYRQYLQEQAQEAAARNAEMSAQLAKSANGEPVSIFIHPNMRNPQAEGSNGINGNGIAPGSPVARRPAHLRNRNRPDPVRDLEMTD